MITTFTQCTWTYWSSRSSIAKAFTVRTLPRASSATPVAFATWILTSSQTANKRHFED